MMMMTIEDYIFAASHKAEDAIEKIESMECGCHPDILDALYSIDESLQEMKRLRILELAQGIEKRED